MRTANWLTKPLRLVPLLLGLSLVTAAAGCDIAGGKKKADTEKADDSDEKSKDKKKDKGKGKDKDKVDLSNKGLAKLTSGSGVNDALRDAYQAAYNEIGSTKDEGDLTSGEVGIGNQEPPSTYTTYSWAAHKAGDADAAEALYHKLYKELDTKLKGKNYALGFGGRYVVVITCTSHRKPTEMQAGPCGIGDGEAAKVLDEIDQNLAGK